MDLQTMINEVADQLGFENTVCLIAAMVLVELWLLNGKK